MERKVTLSLEFIGVLHSLANVKSDVGLNLILCAGLYTEYCRLCNVLSLLDSKSPRTYSNFHFKPLQLI